ncbi:MAG: TRAP transporter small permease subunit [Deltaproteobacteria bacterium]|nr:MAG: TRAP transporter small permease subunit [Deltaproteobacteria bacterium]
MKEKLEGLITPLNRVDEGVSRVEGWIVVAIMSAMLLVGVAQVVARKFFDTGISFADTFLRQMVPWVGLIGAAIAAQENRNIAIDAVTRILPPIGRLLARLLISLLIFVVCVIFIRAGIEYWRFMGAEAAYRGARLFGIPIWRFHIVYPIAFTLIGFHQAVKFLLDIIGLCTGRYDLVKRADEGGLQTGEEGA